ncbi:hypothetical protein BC937DRAFT_90649 [Endogone sp. FLAS-F59071]|nr:hypothetical protein BC937DRAFT_90649 [Endogone sp. FLAS-F59071]|eukprot:RUS22018.1 hypothetical protein BC937DRAFT_90649 [Endogone sp. FLAS-F59071]
MTSTRPGRQERGVRYAANDQDRLKRALPQPVQPWDKKWAALKNGRHLQVFKWVKCKSFRSSLVESMNVLWSLVEPERQLVFDEDDDMDEDEEGIVPSGPSKESPFLIPNAQRYLLRPPKLPKTS